MYAFEPETKRQTTLRVLQDEPNPTKVVRAPSTSKQMVAFSLKNGSWYTTLWWSEVFYKIRLCWHLDNTSCHNYLAPNVFDSENQE